MTAQKKEVKRNPEQKYPHADNNGWIEVKPNKRDANKSSPKEEGNKNKVNKEKKNQFDNIKDSKSEKSPKQKAPAAQQKTKNTNLPKQKVSPSKSEETPKAKKAIATKIPASKSKPAQVPTKNDKSVKVETLVKTNLSSKASKAAVAKDTKKTEGKGRKRTSLGDMFKKILSYIGVALLIVGVLSAAVGGYQQHRKVLDNTIAEHNLEMNKIKMQLDQTIGIYREKDFENEGLLNDLKQEITRLKELSFNARKQVEQSTIKLQNMTRKILHLENDLNAEKTNNLRRKEEYKKEMDMK